MVAFWTVVAQVSCLYACVHGFGQTLGLNQCDPAFSFINLTSIYCCKNYEFTFIARQFAREHDILYNTANIARVTGFNICT